MQAKTYQAEADDHTDQKTEVAGQGGDRDCEEEGWEEGQGEGGQGLDSSKHWAEDRGGVAVEVEDGCIQGHIQLQPKGVQQVGEHKPRVVITLINRRRIIKWLCLSWLIVVDVSWDEQWLSNAILMMLMMFTLLFILLEFHLIIKLIIQQIYWWRNAILI